MRKYEINNLTVSSLASFYEVHFKFCGNKRNILLVVDNDGCFVGAIGVADLRNCALRNDYEKFSAIDICNKSCTVVCENSNYMKQCLDIFYQNNFAYIPIVSKEKKIIDLVHRFRCLSSLMMISYAQFGEDIVFSYVLRDIDRIFYIDIGASDPFMDSVTKWLYDSKQASGINIEPLNREYNLLCADRQRDININAAVGSKEEERILYSYEAASTLITEYTDERFSPVKTSVITLKQVCEKYISENQDIHFLKIDVEGFEKEVLLGADFSKYRPWIIMLEATKPMTMIPTHSEWEYILEEHQYEFVKQYDINRFYIAKEKSFLAERFLDMDILRKRLIVKTIIDLEK
jgi:FkbM family methyltransferase